MGSKLGCNRLFLEAQRALVKNVNLCLQRDPRAQSKKLKKSAVTPQVQLDLCRVTRALEGKSLKTGYRGVQLNLSGVTRALAVVGYRVTPFLKHNIYIYVFFLVLLFRVIFITYLLTQNTIYIYVYIFKIGVTL